MIKSADQDQAAVVSGLAEVAFLDDLDGRPTFFFEVPPAAFFDLAHRAFCAAAILARPSGLIMRRLPIVFEAWDVAEAEAGGRPGFLLATADTDEVVLPSKAFAC